MFYQCQSRKGHVLLRDRVHLDPFKYNIPVSLSLYFPCLEKYAESLRIHMSSAIPLTTTP